MLGFRLQHRLVLGLMDLVPLISVSALPLSIETDSQKPLQVPFEVDVVQPQRRLNGKFLHISDFHPDEFYRVHSSTEEGIACHRGKGLAGTFGAEKTDCDSPYSLVNATFKWIQENIRDQVDFVIWTGDSARHDSDEQHPRHEPEVLRSNRFIADKFFETFSSENTLSIPIVPTFGNNDFLPHNVMYAGPNKWFQSYTEIWHRFIPEEQRHTFGRGGWFSVEVIPNRLAVFSLNTMFFFDRNPAVDGCAHPDEPGYKQLDWLRVQLQTIRERGMKAILMGHVPPARTQSKQLWDETCWQKYTLWLKQYRDVVTGSLYGHMNIDHFLLQDVEDLGPSLGTDQVRARAFLEDELRIESKEDYLQELRDGWADLPNSVIHTSKDGEDDSSDMEDDSDYFEEDDDESIQEGGKHKAKKRKGKYHDIGGKHAQRYQLTLISPSVVPNYLPTLRIVEYNVSGLEDADVWKSSPNVDGYLPALTDDDDDVQQEEEGRMAASGKKKKPESKPGRKPPGDHNLIIPKGPAKGSLPGPGYLAQSLSLTGYTQYFANLTHINDDMPDEVEGARWRQGKHDGKEPKHGEPKPLEFEFEVEYSTLHDKIYKLPDLTVKSYLQLAYRMGEKRKGEKSVIPSDDEWFEDEGDLDEGDLGLEPDVDELGKKHKKKKKENNKTWLNFLSRAFVSTVAMEELRQV